MAIKFMSFSEWKAANPDIRQEVLEKMKEPWEYECKECNGMGCFKCDFTGDCMDVMRCIRLEYNRWLESDKERAKRAGLI